MLNNIRHKKLEYHEDHKSIADLAYKPQCQYVRYNISATILYLNLANTNSLHTLDN